MAKQNQEKDRGSLVWGNICTWSTDLIRVTIKSDAFLLCTTAKCRHRDNYNVASSLWPCRKPGAIFADRLMSMLLNSLSPSINKIADAVNAFQRDSLGSLHKVVFQSSGHGRKYVHKSTYWSKPHGLRSSWRFNTETCDLFRVWIMSFMWAVDFRSCPSRILSQSLSTVFLSSLSLLNDSVQWTIFSRSNQSLLSWVFQGHLVFLSQLNFNADLAKITSELGQPEAWTLPTNI